MGILKLTKIRQERFMKRCAIEFTVGGKTYVGISANFSLSGLFIRSRVQFSPGTVIEMSVHLPHGAISKLTGRVARVLTTSTGKASCLEGGMGVMIMAKDHSYHRFISLQMSSQQFDSGRTEPEVSVGMQGREGVEERNGQA